MMQVLARRPSLLPVPSVPIEWRPRPNPWGVTKREADVLDALLRCQSQKEAARLLCLAPKTVEDYVQKARQRMGVSGHYRHLLMWDRWRNAHLPEMAE